MTGAELHILQTKEDIAGAGCLIATKGEITRIRAGQRSSLRIVRLAHDLAATIQVIDADFGATAFPCCVTSTDFITAHAVIVGANTIFYIAVEKDRAFRHEIRGRVRARAAAEAVFVGDALPRCATGTRQHADPENKAKGSQNYGFAHRAMVSTKWRTRQG